MKKCYTINYSRKTLELVLPDFPLSFGQTQAIQNFVTTASNNGINVSIVIMKG